MKKIIIVFSVFLLIMVTFTNYGVNAFSLDDVFKAAKDFIIIGKEKEEQTDLISTDRVAAVIKPLAQALLAIGTVVLIIVATIMGIKFVISNPEQQAELKKQLIGLVIATVVIYGAYGIWSLVYNVMNKITS